MKYEVYFNGDYEKIVLKEFTSKKYFFQICGEGLLFDIKGGI